MLSSIIISKGSDFEVFWQCIYIWSYISAVAMFGSFCSKLALSPPHFLPIVQKSGQTLLGKSSKKNWIFYGQADRKGWKLVNLVNSVSQHSQLNLLSHLLSLHSLHTLTV